MKKKTEKRKPVDELRPEYDLSKLEGGTRGKYAARYKAGTKAPSEKVTPETAAAIKHARASLARGEGIPHDEIFREFGLKK